MSLARKRRRPRSWAEQEDTVLVDMREFLARHHRESAVEATTVEPSPAPGPPPLPVRPPPRQQREVIESREQQRALVERLRRELAESEEGRQVLLAECRELRARMKRHARHTQDSLSRARLQGTIDHLRASLERAEVAMARERANAAETERALQNMIDESMRTIERLSNKVTHLERERTRALERLEDVEMDRAGKAMQITHLEMSLSQRR